MQWRCNLTEPGIGLKVLTGQGAAIDTTAASGKLNCGIFAALAEFERELISKRTRAALASAVPSGRTAGGPTRYPGGTPVLALASMDQRGNRSRRSLRRARHRPAYPVPACVA